MVDKKVLLEGDIESARIRGNHPLLLLLALKYKRKYSTILNIVAESEAWLLRRVVASNADLPWDSCSPASLASFLASLPPALGLVDPAVDGERKGDEKSIAIEPSTSPDTIDTLAAQRIDSLEHARRTLDYRLNFQANLISAALELERPNGSLSVVEEYSGMHAPCPSQSQSQKR